jgi:hypothetical protein
MTMEGCGPYQIAQKLTGQKVEIPSAHLARHGEGAKIADAVFRQVFVVYEDKRHGGFSGHGAFIYAYLRLCPARIERPQIGGLLNFVVLTQTLAYAVDLREGLIHVKFVRRARADFAVNTRQHEQGCDRSFIHTD